MTTFAPGQDRMIGSLRAVLVIAARDLQRQVRRPGLLVSNAAQVLFFVVIYAVGFDTMVGTVDGVPFSAYVLPGIISIQVATVGITTGLSYAWDREYGVLREMLVAPVPRMCLPAGKVVGTTAIVSVQSLVLLVCAPVFGLRPPAGTIALAASVYVLGAVVFSLLGLFLATVLRRVQTLQASVQLAMFPMLFLSGSVFRPGGVPGWLAALIHVNPLTYLVDLARQVLIGPAAAVAPIGLDLAVLAGLVCGFAGCIRAKIGR
ncbi:ABC transporter permease [Amycolatopsis sp. NPDC059027]|uniref:ABC transporter permease n=1 Tax=unclassified Amycolatopsis TaxID=2618356 RepID=UPI00366FC5DD